MEICDYSDVGIVNTRRSSWKIWGPFLRQLYVCSGVWVLYFVLGLCFGAPTVFVPQIRKEANSTEAVSLDMESWLTSVHGYSALPFVVMIPIFTQFVGRKIPFIIVCGNTIVGYIVFYWSSNTTQLLVSEILQGMLLASNMTLLVVIVTEYTSPRYRGLFMTIESSIFFWGVWIANAVGTFSHWKNIGLIAFACCTFCLSAFFWPESPSWLAMKGRFDECSASHHWLKGYDHESEKELEGLINSQKEYLEQCKRPDFQNYKGLSRYQSRIDVNRCINSDEFNKMNKCNYEEINVEELRRNPKKSWTPFFRQLYVCSGVWVLYFVLGLCFGAPTVFVSQIRNEANSTEAISLEMESWLTSVHGYSALPFVIIIPIFTQCVGRKIPFILVCFNTIIGFVVFYWSNNTLQLLISEILQGMLLASNMTLLIVIVTEYTSPRYRGIFISIESSIFFWGVWMANAVGTFSHWKNIGLVAFGCCGFCLTSFFWPESPSWLAMKGRFNECAVSHHWLKGYDQESEKELESLISSQKEYLEISKRRKVNNYKDKMKIVVETMTTRGFYQPLLLGFAVMSLYHFSGKLVCTMYAVQLIQQITKDEYAGYMGMLVLEGVTILGMQIGCVLSKYLKRRTLLLLFSTIGITFLFIISFYLYLIHLDIIFENQFVSISLMIAFSVTISIGPMIVPSALFGEIIFLRYKSSSLLLLCLYSEFLMATVLKMSPHIFEKLTLHGAFLFYGLCASIFTVVLYKYLPETKDKTLQEIEECFKDRSRSKNADKEFIE